MKKLIPFLVFSISLALPHPCVVAGNQKIGHHPQKSQIVSMRHHGDKLMMPGEVLSQKFNDSIYTYFWIPASSSWYLDEKEFRTKLASGELGQRLYSTLDTITHQWINNEKDIFQYFGSSSDVQTYSEEFWDPVSSNWIVEYYNHYSAPGQEDEYYSKMWNPLLGKFYDGSHELFQYDAAGNDTAETDQVWDSTSNNWVNAYKYTSVYSLNQKLQDLTLRWDSYLPGWVNKLKTEYIYDGSNFLVGMYNSYWDGVNWAQIERMLFTNNATGQPLEELDEYMNGSEWDTSGRTQYTYSASGQLIDKLLQGYYAGTHQWINNLDYSYSFFANGIRHTKLWEQWNPSDNSWIDFSYALYDTTGYSLESYYKYIDFLSYKIVGGHRYLDNYDIYSRFIQETGQVWDTVSGNWINVEQYTDTYEDNVTYVYIQELGTVWDGSNWVNNYEDIFYWSYPSGTGDLKYKSNVCFYENPMHQGNPIDCPSLDPAGNYRFELFDMNGRKVSESRITGNTPFFIDRSVCAGNYLLRISGNGKTVYSGKVIIED